MSLRGGAAPEAIPPLVAGDCSASLAMTMWVLESEGDCVEREDLLRQVSRELRAATRTHQERQERERIQRAAIPANQSKQIKAKGKSSRKAKKRRTKQRHRYLLEVSSL